MDKASLQALVLGVSLAIATIFFENFATLRLPGPSYRPVGEVEKVPDIIVREGPFESNSLLHQAEHRFIGQVHGSETVAISPAGNLYLSDKYGNIYQSQPGAKADAKPIAHLGGGRPLGLAVDANDDVFVCLAAVGLVKVPRGSQSYTVLATQAPQNTSTSRLTPIYFPNSLAIATNGDIYFSDSIDMPPPFGEGLYYDTLSTYFIAILESRKPGRLLKYEEKNQRVTILADQLSFPNGVQLAPDESSVLFCETDLSQVTRLWLKGPQAGTKDIFFDQIPGYPDGLARGKDNTYWISIVAFDQPDLKRFLKFRILKWILPQLPKWLSKPKPGTAVIQVSGEGKLLRYLDDPKESHISGVSSAAETDEGLFLGNVGSADRIGFLPSSLYPDIVSLA